MPKIQAPRVKKPVCNLCAEIMNVSTIPRQFNSNGLVTTKLKRNLEYWCHAYFERVRSDIVLRLLQFLKDNNDTYNDVTIVPSNVLMTLVDSLENKKAELADVDPAKESL